MNIELEICNRKLKSDTHTHIGTHIHIATTWVIGTANVFVSMQTWRQVSSSDVIAQRRSLFLVLEVELVQARTPLGLLSMALAYLLSPPASSPENPLTPFARFQPKVFALRFLLSAVFARVAALVLEGDVRQQQLLLLLLLLSCRCCRPTAAVWQSSSPGCFGNSRKPLGN